MGLWRDERDGMTISVPIAKNPDGSSITGPSYEYIDFDDAKSVSYELTYPATTTDKSKATLTVRARLDDQPTAVPASDWEYVDDKTIACCRRVHPSSRVMSTSSCTPPKIQLWRRSVWRRRVISSRFCVTRCKTVPGLPILLQATCATPSASRSRNPRAP